jgi:hypothetical protein
VVVIAAESMRVARGIRLDKGVRVQSQRRQAHIPVSSVSGLFPAKFVNDGPKRIALNASGVAIAPAAGRAQRESRAELGFCPTLYIASMIAALWK